MEHGIPLRMEAVDEFGNDTKVSAAASNSPEQIGVLFLGGLEDLAGTRDDCGLCDVVDDETVFTGEPSATASETKSRIGKGFNRLRRDWYEICLPAYTGEAARASNWCES